MSFKTSRIKDKGHFREIDNRWKKGYRRRTGSGLYEPRRWSKEEIERVIKHEISDRELSKEIGRSVLAIQIKRCREQGIDKGNKI